MRGARRLTAHLHKRSLSLAGHRTSVALEPAFWAALEALAASGGETLIALLTRLDGARDPAVPLTSCLRVAALAASGPAGAGERPPAAPRDVPSGGTGASG